MLTKYLIKFARNSVIGHYMQNIFRIFKLSIEHLSFSNIINSYRLERFRDKYEGKRCFIIGNGPSLNKTNLSLLKNEITFGLNRIYLNFSKMGYETTFLVSVNKLLLNQCKNEINLQNIPKFISQSARGIIDHNKSTYFLKSLTDIIFSTDITSGISEGGTVTYVALQIAYFMGFKEVILIGVDHNFKTTGNPNKIIYQTKNDLNHFSPNYFKNMRWQLPDLQTSEVSYKLADYHYKRNKKIILDATVDGNLKIFKKIKLEKLFLKSRTGQNLVK